MREVLTSIEDKQLMIFLHPHYGVGMVLYVSVYSYMFLYTYNTFPSNVFSISK